MHTIKKILILLLCVLLAACSGMTSSKTPSTDTTDAMRALIQVRTIKPTVLCDVGVTYERLTAYPERPSDASPVTAWVAYADAQEEWGVRSIGILDRAEARTRSIVSCLADLRRQGLIN